MARRPDLVGVVLRHEREGPAVGVRDLLGGVLVDGVAVGHLRGGGVEQVDLVLALAGLALGELHRHARALQAVADVADDVLVPGGLEDVVVLDHVAVRHQPVVALLGRLRVRVLEQEELELGADVDGEAQLGGSGLLGLQDGPGRHVDRLGPVVLVHQVAQHEGRAVEPRDQAQRRQVGHGGEVAVALLPVERPVARQRVHLDVDGQQVVARLDGALGHGVQEVLAHHPLADQPALVVGEADQDRVHRAVADHRRELVEAERDPFHRSPHRLVCPRD